MLSKLRNRRHTPEDSKAEDNSASPNNTIHCMKPAIMRPNMAVSPPPYANPNTKQDAYRSHELVALSSLVLVSICGICAYLNANPRAPTQENDRSISVLQPWARKMASSRSTASSGAFFFGVGVDSWCVAFSDRMLHEKKDTDIWSKARWMRLVEIKQQDTR